MLELAVTPPGGGQEPPVVLKHSKDLTDLHALSISAALAQAVSHAMSRGLTRLYKKPFLERLRCTPLRCDGQSHHVGLEVRCGVSGGALRAFSPSYLA